MLANDGHLVIVLRDWRGERECYHSAVRTNVLLLYDLLQSDQPITDGVRLSGSSLVPWPDRLSPYL